MSYTDLRDFDPEVIVPIPICHNGEKPMALAVEKLGGGWVGKSYSGTWRYQLTLDGEVVFQGQDYETSTPQTHIEVVRGLVDWFATFGNTDDPYDWGDFKPTKEQLAMFEANHDRFLTWGLGDDDE